MMTLRWILGVLTVAAAVFFVFLKLQRQEVLRPVSQHSTGTIP